MKCCLALAGVAAILSVPALADDAKVRKELEVQYAKFIQAYKNKDIAGIEKIGADDFTIVRGGMTLDRKTAVAQMKQEMAMVIGTPSAKEQIKKLTVKGSTAVALVTGTMSATMKTPDGKTHKMAGSGDEEDTWIKTSGGWKIKKIVEKSMSVTMDGKPVNPQAMAPTGAAAPKKN